MADTDALVVASRGVARVLTVRRPAQRNALDRATLRALARVARAIGRDRDARGLVITGADGFFVAGGDLRDLAPLRTAAAGRGVASRGHDTMDVLRGLPIPVIAAVNGDAYGGGCELAAQCDYRVIDRNATLHWVQCRLGLTTGWGGAARLVELIGPGAAARWLLTGRAIAIDEASSTGFADEVAEAGTSVDAACGFVERVAKASSRATTRAMLALVRGERAARDAARAREVRGFGPRWASREHHEAVARFLTRSR